MEAQNTASCWHLLTHGYVVLSIALISSEVRSLDLSTLFPLVWYGRSYAGSLG